MEDSLNKSSGHTDGKDTCTSDEDNPSSHGNILNNDVMVHYKVQTFNLSVLCSQEFVVEPGSLQFLIQHGFDFNKQFSKGISYDKGVDKVNDSHCTQIPIYLMFN
jgi:hypothetical protein